MAERNEDYEPHPQRTRRPPRAQRGGGRPPYTRGYYHHNEPPIRDLREVLNRKRQEKQEAGQAPPDPSFNFLHDPSREGADSYSKRVPFRGRGGRGRGAGGGREIPRDIESPKNIKVEVTIATGAHVYTMDDTITLPTIKHVPDVKPQYYNNRGRGGNRGRGRGGPIRSRGRFNYNYHTRTINRSRPNKDDAATNKEETVQSISTAEEENWDNLVGTAITHQDNQEVQEHELAHEEEHELGHEEEHELAHEEEHEFDEHEDQEHYEEPHEEIEEHNQTVTEDETAKTTDDVNLQNLNEKITIHVGEQQERKIEIQEELKKLEIKD